MTTYDRAGHEVHAEDVLDREELGDYYDRRGWTWRRPDDETTTWLATDTDCPDCAENEDTP